MSDFSVEFSPTERSSFWKERDRLTNPEILELKGTRSMDRLVSIKARLPYDVNFEELANDLYGEIFIPFEQEPTGYRQSNTIVIGSNVDRPDYTLVPKYMKNFAIELAAKFDGANENPEDVSKMIECAAKAHENLAFIHPFIDGNGRVARGLANYVILRLGYFLPHWRFDERANYLNAVENGFDNPKAFEKFINGSLIASYREKEERLNNNALLSHFVTDLSETRQKLEKHAETIKRDYVQAI